MEQSQTLKEMSMIGLQLDGKLQRMVVIFQTMCVEGKKIPSKDLFVEIRDLLGDARMVFNLSPAKTSVDIIMEKLNGLNKKLDALLEKIG